MPAGLMPMDLGNRVLEKSYRVGPAAGLLPFRMVVFANVDTPFLGNRGRAPVQYPNVVQANGERVIGVFMDPAAPDYGAATPALRVVAKNKPINVRHLGIAPLMTDTTTGATNINVGDGVAASVTAGQDGTGRKATLSGNAFAAGQHILGYALNRVSANSLYVMVFLQPSEA